MNRSLAKRVIEDRRWTLRQLRVMFLVLLAGHCLGEGKGGVDETRAVPMVQKILSKVQLSGSLEFWGRCDIAWPRPEFPRLRPVSGHEGSALDALQEMFSDDAKMRVTQDTDGKIRMVETDVPQDFLEVKIHHLSFPSDYHGPRGAVYAILHTPEVMDFMAHKIGPARAWGGWGMPSEMVAVGMPSVRGELNNVTVAQALDYVLKMFPGFWTYQNCHDPEGRRTIFIGFHDD